MVPVKKVDKRDLVLVEYESANKADFLFEKMERLCFELLIMLLSENLFLYVRE